MYVLYVLIGTYICVCVFLCVLVCVHDKILRSIDLYTLLSFIKYFFSLGNPIVANTTSCTVAGGYIWIGSSS